MGAVAQRVLATWKSLKSLSPTTLAIAALLFAETTLGLISPSLRSCLTLIPGQTIRYPWNLVTSSFIEPSLLGLCFSLFVLAVSGSVAEPIYGPLEFLKLICIAAATCGTACFLIQYTVYFAVRHGPSLFAEQGGFSGVQGALLVAIKHVMPGQDVTVLPGVNVPTRYLPLLYLSMCLVWSMTFSNLNMLRYAVLGTTSGWFYLRFYKPSGPDGQRGDPSADFALSTLCPAAVQPVFSVLFTAVAKFLGFHRDAQPGLPIVTPPRPAAASQEVGPGQEWDAARRRELGRQALEARLAMASGVQRAGGHPLRTGSPSPDLASSLGENDVERSGSRHEV